MRGSCEDNVAKPDAVGDRGSLQGERPSERNIPARRGQRLQFARGDHFGEQHGRRLERLDLLFGIGAACLVLDDQHAEGIAASQNWHAEERRIDFLAGLRPVHERRMRLRIGKRERLGGLGNQADETFARAQRGQMNGFTVQAFRRIKFEPAVGAQRHRPSRLPRPCSRRYGQRSCRGGPAG